MVQYPGRYAASSATPSPSRHEAAGWPYDLAPIFPMNLVEQEMITERWIDIPEGVLEKFLLWRPSPVHRASAFEKALDTPCEDLL